MMKPAHTLLVRRYSRIPYNIMQEDSVETIDNKSNQNEGTYTKPEKPLGPSEMLHHNPKG